MMTRKALPPTRLNGLLPKPTCRQQGRGRQRGGSGAAGQHWSYTARELGCHLPNLCSFPWGQSEAGQCWGGYKPQAEGAQPPSQPMGDLDLPRLHLDIYLWWHYCLRPVLQLWGQQYVTMRLHMMELSSHPQPGWCCLPGQGRGVALPGTCLLTQDRVRLACKGKGSHLNVRWGKDGCLIHSYSLKFHSVQTP